MTDPDALITAGERLLARVLDPADRAELRSTLQAATAGVAGAQRVLPTLIGRLHERYPAAPADLDDSP